ncbi:signal peptidase I [Microbacterium sp. NPDC078428]|uniref:signal peptidase I n=1 Tax=Microbacterium sp. NPDC078428 TaxID=3364190 RepID=UPI0037CC2BDF
MLRALRFTGNALLWALAGIGVLSGALWGANALGLVQPLVVISGSMEPGIMTGDLIFSTPTPVEDVEVGEVASLRSDRSDNLVTHRIIEISAIDGGYAIRMQGDANDAPDGESYFVASETGVWQPALTIPGGGRAVQTLAQPGVAIPLLVSIGALIILAALPSRRADTTAPDDPEGVPGEDTTPPGISESRIP